ncbi:hypothetical protein TELCIR_24776 [Teladorsagia circumcincta]|uniref:Uncharacterized protein n=1 Tax=Teladorsagia circumcincta TaxID=45464 RepID=A0A2G9T7E6_TELCI|nr:hypothetical protein TELCIR_24776 [Teladorsagia circumcincta]
MKNVVTSLDFLLSASLCSSQLVFAVVKTIAKTMDSRVLSANDCSFDDFMCAFWFLAFCGCITRRRYIIVFTTMAMFYTFVLAFKWSTAASYSYFTNTPLSCTREVRQTYPRWCKNADVMFLAASVVCIIITLSASVLSALRLWSDEDDYEDDEAEDSLLAESRRTKGTKINAFRYSIDR